MRKEVREESDTKPLAAYTSLLAKRTLNKIKSVGSMQIDFGSSNSILQIGGFSLACYSLSACANDAHARRSVA